MLNKKGFTIAEVIVSFSLVSIILASTIAATIFYRDKLKNEEVTSQLWDFKMATTKAIYDDIINHNIVRAEYCVGTLNCVNFVDKEGNSYVLKIVDYNTPNKKGTYLSYNDIQYMLPDSDLESDLDSGGNNRLCNFTNGIQIDSYNNQLYKVKLSYLHKNMDQQYDLLFVISS